MMASGTPAQTVESSAERGKAVEGSPPARRGIWASPPPHAVTVESTPPRQKGEIFRAEQKGQSTDLHGHLWAVLCFMRDTASVLRSGSVLSVVRRCFLDRLPPLHRQTLPHRRKCSRSWMFARVQVALILL